MAEGRALGPEQLAEPGEVDLAPLELGPGVGIRVGGVQPPNEPFGQPGLPLVVREALEGPGGEDPTEVEQDGSDHAWGAGSGNVPRVTGRQGNRPPRRPGRGPPDD